LQIFGVSVAIGAIAGLAQSNTRYGLDASATDAYRQGVASSLSQSSLHILDRYLNVLPTFTIREGHRIKVYLSEDLLLPDCARHEIPNGFEHLRIGIIQGKILFQAGGFQVKIAGNNAVASTRQNLRDI